MRLGDIDLIAPLGTIDAGEAGIRFSGNANLAALHIVNAANIQGQGTTTGIPTIQAPNIGGLTEASNASGAAAQQATQPRSGPAEQPSVIIVEILGFGGGQGGTDGEEEEQRRRRKQSQMQDPTGRVQVLAAGEISDTRRRQLVEEKRRQVGRQ